MADQIDVSDGAPGPTGETAGGERPYQFGLPAAMALIVGIIIGVGIFNLPTSLAFYGPITLVSMALTTVGALVLALLFASLSRRLPADGGPYAYARAAFGNRLGFANAWSYWIYLWPHLGIPGRNPAAWVRPLRQTSRSSCPEELPGPQSSSDGPAAALTDALAGLRSRQWEGLAWEVRAARRKSAAAQLHGIR